MDELTVAELRRRPVGETQSWVLSRRLPLAFEDVSFDGDYDEDRALSSALGWIENHVSTERPDLLED